MGDAYARILTRLGAQWRAAQADSGLIGGAESREYLLLSDVGEDTLLYTADGLYTANAERGVSRPHPAPASPFSHFERRRTPGTSTVADACAALGCEASQMVKNVLYEVEFREGEWPSTRPVLISLLRPQLIRQAMERRVLDGERNADRAGTGRHGVLGRKSAAGLHRAQCAGQRGANLPAPVRRGGSASSELRDWRQ